MCVFVCVFLIIFYYHCHLHRESCVRVLSTAVIDAKVNKRLCISECDSIMSDFHCITQQCDINAFDELITSQ